MFILYDSRAVVGGPDDAVILDTAETEAEAREIGEEMAGYDGVWYEYQTKGKELVNGKIRMDLPPICKE